MKILITGNLGYLGPWVVRQLRAGFAGAELVGVDVGYYAIASPTWLAFRRQCWMFSTSRTSAA